MDLFLYKDQIKALRVGVNACINNLTEDETKYKDILSKISHYLVSMEEKASNKIETVIELTQKEFAFLIIALKSGLYTIGKYVDSPKVNEDQNTALINVCDYISEVLKSYS